jgi:hypothetical protein
MAGADRDEMRALQRFLRLAQLQRDIDEAARADDARRRLEHQLHLDAARDSAPIYVRAA